MDHHVLHVIHEAGWIKMPACTVNLILGSKCRNPTKQSVRPPRAHGCVMKIKHKEASGLTRLSGRETQYSDSVSSVQMFHGILFQESLLQFGSVGKQSSRLNQARPAKGPVSFVCVCVCM